MVMFPLLTQAQELVKGKVTDLYGEPLVGATVMIKKTFKGTVTDAEGLFSLKVRNGDILIFSFIGYKSKEVVYADGVNLSIKLEDENKQIDDVVVVGYGTQIKEEVTGSLTSIKMSKLTDNQASESFETLLQGKIAGVNIQLNSGEPGSSPTVIIRGLAAVSRDDNSTTSDPLYVVDGVPIISKTSDDFAVTSTNVLADLDPSDIDEIVVLKDASAAAIYGSRAANGVILITTKKGQKGRPQINFNLRCGINFVPQLRDVAGGKKEREEVEQLYDLYAPYGVYMPDMYTDITNPFYNNSSDWQGYLYNTSVTQDYNASIRGAGDFGQYSVSMGYMDSEGILFNTGFKRYSVLANTTFKALKDAVVVNNIVSASRSDQSKNPDALSANYSSLLPLPDDPSLDDVDVYGLGSDSNIDDKLRYSTDATIKIRKDLSFKSQVSFEYDRAMRDIFNEDRTTLEAGDSSMVSETRNLLVQNTLTYAPDLGENNNVSVLLGQSAEKTEIELTKATSVTDAQTMSETVDWSTDNNIGESDYEATTMLSYFSRVNYAFKQKYMLGASLRADGSSKFGASNRWGIFPSASAGWNFAKEKFFEDKKWLSKGKIRFSYGVSGTTWDEYYLALGVMDGGDLDRYNSLLNISYGGISGYTPSWYDGYKNDDLTWVKSQMSDIGLDLSFFDNRIEFIFDGYEKLTKGLLLSTSLPTTSGYNEVYTNAADVLNRGVELTLNTNTKITRNLHWSMGLNFAYNKNRVVSLPDGNADIIRESDSGEDFGSIVRVGAPLNGFFFYQSQGVYQTENQIPVNPNNGSSLVGLDDKVLAVGDRNFKDQNGDYEIDVDDRIYAGDPNPKWTGGWTNDFSYKGFDLNVVSTFIIGRDIVNTELLNRLTLDEDFAGSVSLPNFDHYSIWEKSGDNAKYPTLNPWNDVNQIITQDSEYIEDGSYFKIKSVTLSYNFNKNLLQKSPFVKARVYCTLDNVYTFQNYSGPDAELITVDGFDDSNGYPNRQMLMFGISFGL